MSYGQAYLSKNKNIKRTIGYKRSYSRRRVENEGIVTSHLPAYTDIVKIRFRIVRYPVLVNALQLHVSTFPVGKCMVVVYLRCQHAVPKKSSPNWDTWQGLYVSASSGMGSKHTFAWIGYRARSQNIARKGRNGRPAPCRPFCPFFHIRAILCD